MTKKEIVKRIDSVKDLDKTLRDMLVSYINLAYDMGFEEGMKVGGKVQAASFDMLNKSLKVKP